MQIDTINWLSKEGLEAEVIITDGLYKLKCFAHPFKMSSDNEIKNPLYAFDTSNIQRSLSSEYYIEKQSHEYSYCITGLLVNKMERIMKVGEIIIELDTPVAEDIGNNEFITFCCERIDLIT